MQVVVELVPQTDKVETAIDQLNRKGAVSDAAAQSYQKGNSEIQKRNTLLQNEAKAIKSVDDAQKKQIKTVNDMTKGISIMVDEFMKGVGEGMADAANEAGISMEELFEKIRKATEGINEQADAEENLKSKLRQMKAEIALLMATEEEWSEADKQRYDELIAKAGQYNDAIGDANEAIARSGSDTRGLDNVIDVTQGVAAGFSVVQGATALFGAESEDLQKTLIKLNAVMAISQGLQQIQDLTSKKYIQTLLTLNRTQLINNAQIAIENGLQSQSIVVRAGATAAQYALNVAMALNPIGIFVAGLAAAIIMLKNYSEDVRETAAAQAKLNGAVESGTLLLQAELEAYDNSLKRRLADLDAAGKKQSEQLNAEIETTRLKAEATLSELNNLKAVIQANKDLNIDNKAALDLELSLTKQLNDLNTEGYVKKRQLEKALRDEQKTTADEAKKLSEDAERKAKEAREKALKAMQNEANDRKALAEISLLYVKQMSDEELQARIKVIEAERDAALASDELTINQRSLLYAKANDEIIKLRKQYVDQEIKTTKEVELLKAQTRVLSFKEGTAGYFDAQRQFIATQAELSTLEIQQSTDTEEVKAEKIKQVNLKLHADLEQLNRQAFEREINARYERISRLQQVELNNLNRQAQDIKLTENQRFKALQEGREKELAILDDNRAKIYDLALAGVIDREELENRLSENKEEQERLRFDIAQSYAQREMDLRKALGDAIVNTMTGVIQTVANIESANRQAQLDAELDRIDREREAALDNKNLTESQKNQIEKRYNQEAAKVKTAAAKRERDAQIAQAGALAVMSILRSLAEYAFPYNLIAAGAAGGAAALQIIELSSKPLPQYWTGTKSAKRGWAWVGEKGPELVKLNGGERILNANQSAKVGAQWDRNNYADPDTILSNNTPGNHTQALSDYVVNSAGNLTLDYDKMGEKIASHMPKQPAVSMNADMDGFSMFVTTENSKTEIRNKRYSS